MVKSAPNFAWKICHLEKTSGLDVQFPIAFFEIEKYDKMRS